MRMKTIDQIILKYESNTLDGRDVSRLSMFVQESDLYKMGISLKEEFIGKHEHIEFTKENILKQLEKDLDFAFDKAIGQRGIAAGMMFEVIYMWNWILEDGLEDWDRNNYAQYGLPLFKATAVKYGFENPIGEDVGNEYHYAE
jgi:hypothetical protein